MGLDLLFSLLVILADSCQLLDGILGTSIDHFALKKDTFRSHQVLLHALLGLVGYSVEGVATVLVWQLTDKGE